MEPTLHSYEIHGIALAAYDAAGSQTADRVAEELTRDSYGFARIPFQPDDVVIDLGAHVGLVSLYLAKRWPFLRIHAFEPHPTNYQHCVDNLRLNQVSNVQVLRLGVSVDARPLVLRWVPRNTGGSTAVFDLPAPAGSATVETLTLADVFERALPSGQRCRLLKIDCEGIEHEILPSPLLERVDFLSGEFHEVANHEGHVPTRALTLITQCAHYIPWDRLRVMRCMKQD